MVVERFASQLRWRLLLASCDYDPSRDGRLDEAGPDDFVIAGCPRTGTSLIAAQLFRPPSVVTCMEPWDGLRMPLRDLMVSIRDEVASGVMRRGRLDLRALEEHREVRWIGESDAVFPVHAGPGFQLGVKWPAFWRYVPLLKQTRFLLCVRHPVDTVMSFAGTQGRLARGLDYDVAINRVMNQELQARTRDPLVRRAMLWEYIHSQLVPHLDRPNVTVIRYEQWQDDSDGVLAGIGDFLGVTLRGSVVDLRAPQRVDAGPEVWAVVAQHCPSAAALGYVV